MNTLTLPPFLSMFGRARPMELRIDVQLPPERLDTELDKLHQRLHTPGDSLHACATLPAPFDGLVFRYRQADGEHYVYVEDVVRRRLAGYTVFNRLVELDRRADRHLRGPHSKYAEDYQRRGIASAVYQWALDSGICLISGPRQSTGAHGLWCALARRHPLGYVQLREKVLTFLGIDVEPPVLDDFHTRMVLLGRGWTIEQLMADTGCLPARQAAACSGDRDVAGRHG